jgi:hypothetical protein
METERNQQMNEPSEISNKLVQDYYGTKRVTATPAINDKEELGYKVIYEDGYESWSPAQVFEAAYQPITSMNFGHALAALEDGHRVARTGWNGKGMWLYWINGSDGTFSASHDDDYILRIDSLNDEFAGLARLPWIGLKTADGGFVPWTVSQTDMLAKDWTIVE